MPRGGKREGAGRKPTPKPNKVRTSLTLNPWANNWLKKQSKLKSLSKSELVEKVIMSFATVKFDQGMNVHNAETYFGKQPTDKGFYAEFRKDGSTFVGAFETAKDAYAVGIGLADFRRVVAVNDEGVMSVYYDSLATLEDIH